MFSFGPGGFETAHGVDSERVPVEDLVDHCAATALTAMRFCGTVVWAPTAGKRRTCAAATHVGAPVIARLLGPARPGENCRVRGRESRTQPFGCGAGRGG